ncbi:MAG: Ig-like domain-containing protein [Saprospiraceae bacterium]
MQVFKQVFFSGVLLVCLSQCANIGRPEGGERDKIPPVIDSLHSTQMMQTNFHPDLDKTVIEINFNEWVKLMEAQKQIVISPPLLYPPKIEPRGKGVRIKLDPREVLLDNTTYTINFGSAIRDLNEGNEARDLRFVFSTGPVIDSGEVSGKIYDALTHEAKEDILIMLYYAEADSVVYKSKPIYFSRSDKSGRFSIKNIKDTTYKIFVLNDANSNYQYDQDKEEIGYLRRRVKTGEDSTTILIPYFKSFVRPRITAYNTDKAGVLKIQSNVNLEDLTYQVLADSVHLIPLQIVDTLMYFYSPSTARNWLLLVNYKDSILDTIPVNRVKINTIDSLKIHPDFKEVMTLAPNSIRKLEFNIPLIGIDTSGITLLDDSTAENIPVGIKITDNQNEIEVICPCIENKTYTVTFLPGSIKSFNSTVNKDTIVIKMRAFKTEQSGTMFITISDLDSVKNYTVNLLKDNKPVSTRFLHKTVATTLNYTYLTPATYSIQIIEDNNQNGKWDSGSYRYNIFPEKTVTQGNFNVRANWELREQIIWKP